MPSTRPSRSTIDRPRPRPRAARAPWSSRWNSSNTAPLLLGRNAEAGVPDLDPHRAGQRRQPTSTRPFGVYLIALETRFCSSRRISRRSERTAERGRDEPAARGPWRAPIGANSISSCRKRSATRDVGDLRPRRAGVEARNVEQRAENLLDRLERGVDVARQIRPAPRRRSRPPLSVSELA